MVAKRTFRSHRQNFFNHKTKKWEKCNRNNLHTADRSSDDTESEENNDGTEHSSAHENIGAHAGHRTRKQEDYIDFFMGSPPCSDSKFQDQLLEQIRESWDSVSEDEIDNDLQSDVTARPEKKQTAKESEGIHSALSFKPIIDWMVLFISCWVSAFNVSTAALTALLHFLGKLFYACSVLCPVLVPLKDLFPKTTYLFNKATFNKHTHFEKYVVCPKCHKLYIFGECVQKDRRGKETSKVCDYVEFADHRYKTKREKCGTTLLKEVTLQNGKVKLYPRKLYCFKSVSESLAFMIQRPGFLERCEHWRKRSCMPGVYRDVYDGRVWRKFMHFEGRPFLAEPGKLALMLNMDFFQPFKHSIYSVGVIYLAVMNLPRKERFLKENIIIAGVIPGPKEPNAQQLNCYLKPLVDDLLVLWERGLSCTVDGHKACVFAMVIAIAADLPAARKLVGFLSKYQ